MIQLSNRLQTVADLITAEGVLADIGTDHGYIPIYLVQKGCIKKAIAADIKKGPLLRAKEHIEKYGLGEYIETRLSDGAQKIQPKEADIIVIAGMGGGLMQKIIEKSKEVFFLAEEIILQPQSEQEQLRRYLIREGFEILAEDMVKEDGKYYPMMRIAKKKKECSDCVSTEEQTESGNPDKNPYENKEDTDFLYGAYLIRDRHPVLKEFLEREAVIYRELLENLRKLPENEGIQKRIVQIAEKEALTKRALERIQ